MDTILITGASKGIGKAIAYECASRKMNVVLVARSEDLLEKIAGELTKKYSVKVWWNALDVSLPASPAALLAWVEKENIPVNGLVNNAGFALWGRFDKHPLEAHFEMMRLNIDAVISLTHLFLPMLKKAPVSYLQFVASTGSFQPSPYLGLYTAGKTLISNFSQSLRYELKEESVKISCLYPGPTISEMYIRQGTKELNDRGKRFMMPTAVCAKAGVTGMLKGKRMIVPGFMNKFTQFLAWSFPRALVISITGKTLFRDH